jgi:hypothetical protein
VVEDTPRVVRVDARDIPNRVSFAALALEGNKQR